MPDDAVADPRSRPRPERSADPAPGSAIEDAILAQSLDAIVITDPEFRIRVWNPAAERLYGIPASDAIGRSMTDLVETSDTSGVSIDGLIARDELQRRGTWRQLVIHRPLFGSLVGTEVTLDSLVTLLHDTDGRPMGVLAVNRDVTASTRLESELAALGTLVIATGRARSRTEVAEAALEILCRATGASAGLVTSTDGTYEATAQLGVNQATIDAVLSFGQLAGPLSRALEVPGSVVSADIATAPLREDVRAAVMANGIGHLLIVGLRLSGRLTGVLALGWRQRAPREPSRPIIHQAAALVVAAMENARLLTAVESGLGEERLLTRRIRALVELTRLPEAAASTGHGIDHVLREVGDVIGADGCLYARVVDDQLVLESTTAIDRSQAEPLVNRPIADLPFVTALSGGSAAVLFPLGGPLATAEGTASGQGGGYRSVAAFAVREHGVPYGILLALFKRPVDELEVDERTLEAVGRVLDISFGNRRLRAVVEAGERRYRDLFEASPEALLVEDLNDVVDANRAARELFGRDVAGRPVNDLFVADRWAADRADIGPDGSRNLQVTGRRRDGSTFPAEVDLRPIDIDGQERILAIVRDLTERTRMQAELIQAQKMDAIGMLVAGVAHELNNPLASIVGFSHLIRTDPKLPADLRTQADMLVQEADRTRVIVQNLLDFARLRPPERVEVGLRPLLDSVLGLQSYVLSRNQLAVEVDLGPDLPTIWVDRSQMQQVLINLTVNASQAIREADRPGTIRIRARSDREGQGPTVRIEIADDGPGVPSSVLDRLFLPFVTTKPPGAGTGLGLSVSFGIVRSHGGTLRHEPTPGGGATFIIELPVGGPRVDGEARPGARADVRAAAPSRSPEMRARPGAASGPAPAMPPATMPPAAKRAARNRTAASAPAAQPSGRVDRPARVMVLDDEPAIREFLGRVLKRQGHEPILTETGEQALEIIRTRPPDAILCDHRMAGMSGTDVLAAVIEIDPALARRFVFMSGDALNPELREFADAHGVQLLAKPFDIPAVDAIVASLVGRGPA